MHRAWWVFALLALAVGARTSNAQVIHASEATREIYCIAAVSCSLQSELRRSPAEPYQPFADTIQVSFECNSWTAYAYGGALQNSTISGDSIVVIEGAWAGMYNEAARSGLGRSNASIQFHLENGHWYSYLLDVWGQSYSEYGVARTSFSLSLLGSGGGVVESQRTTAGPGRTRTVDYREFRHRGILEAGEYLFEANTSADGSSELEAGGELRIQFEVRLIPTDVAPATWGRVKMLYR